ncbi:MAG: division/cell wall cluster transcriptional repressor MraZ, partial [Chloroflexota bacterium]|nr:division/cell wall cluster transcriptional repressor MraZ [Chloroflexota bacterium]
PDRQGRILLPQYLREYAGIDNESVVIGLYARLEIWNPIHWEEVRKKVEEEGDIIADQLADLGI